MPTPESNMGEDNQSSTVRDINSRIHERIREFAQDRGLTYQEAAQRARIPVDGFTLDPDKLTFDELPSADNALLHAIRNSAYAENVVEFSGGFGFGARFLRIKVRRVNLETKTERTLQFAMGDEDFTRSRTPERRAAEAINSLTGTMARGDDGD